MRRNARLRPSPSMAVAFLALLVALGGTSYAVAQLPANSVGAKQLKKNAVTAAKVKDRSLLAQDFKSGQLPSGPRGAQGPAGPAGERGPAGATNVTVRSGAPGLGRSTANCFGGERAVGGGGVTPDADSFLWVSSPNVQDGTPTGWIAEAVIADGLGTEANVTAYVVCAAP